MSFDSRFLEGTKDINYKSKYPDGIDLTPGSELHNRIATRVLRIAQESHEKVQKRFTVWDSIDEQLTCYVDLSTQQLEDDAKEGYVKKKPVHVIVPMQYAIRETLLTYLCIAFLDDPIFRYDFVGNEDVVKAMMLQQAVDIQVRRRKVALNLYTQWSDNLTYGYGAVTTPWDVETKIETRVTPIIKKNMFFQNVKVGENITEEEVVSFEGNRLDNINPRLFLPDPNVAINDVQRGESVGWILRTNYVNLLGQEKGSKNIYNVEYIKSLSMMTSSLMPATSAGDKVSSSVENASSQYLARPVDVIYMYINLIPNDWGLGPGRYPEKWLFGLAGDKILIRAQRLGLNHGMYPVAIAASEFDGYAVTPISKLETVHEMAKAIDWFETSRVANVRKVVNDMILFDPSRVRQDDLENPTPGMFVRLRETAWDRGVEGAMMQFKVNDVTQGHIQDIAVLSDMMYSATGAVDSVRGIMRGGSERRSAKEAGDTHSSALSRLARMAKIISLQSMQDLSYIFAYQTQQLMTKRVYAKVSATTEQMLREEYGYTNVQNGKIAIDPEELQIEFDVIPRDGTIPGGENVEAMLQAYQIAAAQPMIAQGLDMTRLFLHIMRESGARNINEFKIKAKVVDQEEIAKQAQAGNYMPLPKGGESGNF
jgi:hypothetical protein